MAYQSTNQERLYKCLLSHWSYSVTVTGVAKCKKMLFPALDLFIAGEIKNFSSLHFLRYYNFKIISVEKIIRETIRKNLKRLSRPRKQWTLASI